MNTGEMSNNNGNGIPTNHNLIVIYSDPTAADSHRVRLLAAEKENLAEIIDVMPSDIPESFLEINPKGTFPTLRDKDIILSDPLVMMEYIDERFPNPALLPLDPVQRAILRMMLARIREELMPHVAVMDHMDSRAAEKKKARRAIIQLTLDFKPGYTNYNYCYSDTYSMVDVSLAPVFWRFRHYDIDPSVFGDRFELYTARLFKRASFLESLSVFEENMRP